MPTILEQFVAEGEARGEARRAAESVLTVLRARFAKVPKQVENTIRQMVDPIALDSLTAHAATCKSLDDFAKSLK